VKERVLTAIVAGAVFIGFLLLGGQSFSIFVALMAIIGVMELFKMRKLEILSVEGVFALFATVALVLPWQDFSSKLPVDFNHNLFIVFAFLLLIGMVFSKDNYGFEDVAFPFLTSFYVGTGFHYLVEARYHSMFVVLLALFIVWSTDIFAYVVGKAIGKTKLMPSVSPNKTVEGSLGGVVFAIITTAIMMLFFNKGALDVSLVKMLFLALVFSIFGQLGDLVESSIKRQYGVKDSGKLLPGHGGILDRFDSLLFVFPLMHVFGLF
jgi:phosphatidate cytidylyltransferase